MFPPLCFVDVSSGVIPYSSRELLNENLEDEEYKLIFGNSPDVMVKFRVVEVFQNITTRI